MSMLRRRIEAKRMGEQRPVEKPVAGKQRIVAGLGIILDTTGSEQFMLEIERRVSFKARFAKETKDRQEKLSEMRGEVATAQRVNALKTGDKVKLSKDCSPVGKDWMGFKKGHTLVFVSKQKNGYRLRFPGDAESVKGILFSTDCVETSETAPDTSATARKGIGTKLPIQGEPQRAGVCAKADKVQGIEDGETLVGRVEIGDDTYAIKAKKEGDKFYAYKDDARQSKWAKVSGLAGQPTMELLKQALSGFYKDIEFAENGRFKSFAAADLSVAVPEGVSPEAVEEGAKVEKEHGTTYNQIKEYYTENGEFPPFDMVTEWIASDHLKEFADYYEALEAMEEELKAGEGTGAEAMRAKASGNTEKAINKAVNEYWEPKLGERGKRLVNWLNSDLYHGPYPAGTTDEEDNPDATYPGFTAAIDELREIIDNAGGFQDMYYDNEFGSLMENEPEAYEDEETGEMVEPYLEETYHLESRDVARYVLGKELVSYVI